MALEVEDGTGKSNSQTYATAVQLKEYARQRGVTLTNTDGALEILLVKAMDYLESELVAPFYVGYRKTKEQALSWPRYEAEVECWPIDSDEIPRQLIHAQCAAAIEANTTDLLPTQTPLQAGPVIRKRVEGAVEVEYANTGNARNVPAMAKVDALLRVLMTRNGLVAVRT